MPFVTCATCGSDTLFLFGGDAPGRCRTCSTPLGGNANVEPWVLRAETDGFDIVRVGGSLEGDAVAALEAELVPGGDHGTVVDLSRCTFIGASAIELLIEATLASGADPAFFSVVGARGAVAQMIDFADGGQGIPRFPDLGAALAAVESKPSPLL